MLQIAVCLYVIEIASKTASRRVINTNIKAISHRLNDGVNEFNVLCKQLHIRFKVSPIRVNTWVTLHQSND
jgi:hypothetical protein